MFNMKIYQKWNIEKYIFVLLGEEYEVLAPAISSSSEGWKGFIYMAHAVIDTEAAWAEVNSLTGWAVSLVWLGHISSQPYGVSKSKGSEKLKRFSSCIIL